MLWLLFLLTPAFTWGQTEHVTTPESCRILDSVLISGRHKTKRAVILREISVRKGECIPNDSLSAWASLNKLRLMNLMIFNEAKVGWDTLVPGHVVMEIYVIDRFPVFPEPNVEFADRNFNVWWQEQHRDLNRINLGLTLVDNNFRGNREAIAFTGQVGYTQKIGISYSRPFADKSQKNGFGIAASALQNKEIAYKTENNKLRFYRDNNNFMLRRFDFSGWYTYRPAYAVKHTFKLTYQHYWISNTIAGINPDYLGQGNIRENVLDFQYRYEYNGVDNWNYPLRGNRFIGRFEQSFTMVNKTFQTSFLLHYDQYFHPFRHWYLAFIFRGRSSFPQQQPYIFRQNLGYDFNYIRGFEYYVMDGSSFGLLRMDIKRKLLDHKIYLPVRYFEVIPIRVFAKAFADGGISYNKFPVQDALNNKGLYAMGIGIDIVTLYDIKVRIEYTLNSLGEKGLFLHKSGE